jgi:hypothetical protein
LFCIHDRRGTFRSPRTSLLGKWIASLQQSYLPTDL